MEYLNPTDPGPDRSPAALGRRELSLLLCTALLRAAGQDWHEQGDVWHRVQRMRPLPPDLSRDRLRSMGGKLQRLLALDTERTTVLVDPHGSQTSVRSWLAAASEAGQALAELARTGTLRPGLRDILAHHVIFHWNRLGLTAAAQAVLARTAAATILNTLGEDAAGEQPTSADVAQA